MAWLQMTQFRESEVLISQKKNLIQLKLFYSCKLNQIKYSRLLDTVLKLREFVLQNKPKEDILACSSLLIQRKILLVQ